MLLRTFGVQFHPGQVESARRCIRSDLPRTKSFRTPAAQLSEGHAVCHPSRDVAHTWPGIVQTGVKLLRQQWNEIAWVKTVTDLVAVAVETDVTKRCARSIGIDPVAEDSLLRLAELACARGQFNANSQAFVDLERPERRASVRPCSCRCLWYCRRRSRHRF
jgi:hypothetical protein